MTIEIDIANVSYILLNQIVIYWSTLLRLAGFKVELYNNTAPLILLYVMNDRM